MNIKKSYAFAGASQRAYYMYMLPLKGKFSDRTEVVGVYDINHGRAQVIAQKAGISVFDNFEDMIKENKPDVVIVTVVDAFHSDYIIKAMELGCDVITEKPMSIDTDRINAILAAEKRTGKKVIVTFNYRYTPCSTQIKRLISSGAIGDIFSVHFEWMLDRNMDISAHGTSYFRRWNSRMKSSGGLLVHKSTHHFDLVNWWLDKRPQYVSAFGELKLYGKVGSDKYADGIFGEKCRSCNHVRQCGFYYELNGFEKEIYAANEHIDGYFKDGCVYARDIDIYDTMAVNVKYEDGILMTYSLNATCPYEGWRISINGSAGRMEIYMPETGLDNSKNYDEIRVFDLHNNVVEYKISKASGGHGGGDERLHEMLFGEVTQDPLGHAAGTKDGAYSCIIGAAANLSIKEKRIIDVDSILNI